MALPSSGAISFSSIGGEMGISASNNLSYLSAYAGNSSGYIPSGLTSSPYAMGEFFGFSFQSMTYTAIRYKVGDPCGREEIFYMGSDGLLYYNPGSGRVDGEFIYEYSYYDWWTGYVYNMYFVNSGNMNYYGENYSGCGPW